MDEKQLPADEARRELGELLSRCPILGDSDRQRVEALVDLYASAFEALSMKLVLCRLFPQHQRALERFRHFKFRMNGRYWPSVERPVKLHSTGGKRPLESKRVWLSEEPCKQGSDERRQLSRRELKLRGLWAELIDNHHESSRLRHRDTVLLTREQLRRYGECLRSEQLLVSNESVYLPKLAQKVPLLKT